MITLKDLAATVGVSPSAVSLVLNGRDKGRVNTATAQRIREAAEEMGYIPNQLARGLKIRRTHTLGVVSDRVASVPFAGHMLEGVQATAAAAGYVAMVIDTANDPALFPHASKSLLQRDIDALIVAAEYHREIDLPSVPPDVPVVTLDGFARQAQRADGVVPEEYEGAFSATRHLLDAGHRRIAHVTVGGGLYVASAFRLEGYRAALQRHGADADARLVLELEGTDTAAAYPRVRDFLDTSDRPTAVFCFSDQIAFAVFQAATDLGLSIPEDLSVVGFDDQQFIADALRPALTTVRLPHYEMGAWAAQRALDRASQQATGPVEVHRELCPLVERRSVGAPRA